MVEKAAEESNSQRRGRRLSENSRFSLQQFSGNFLYLQDSDQKPCTAFLIFEIPGFAIPGIFSFVLKIIYTFVKISITVWQK